MADSIVKLRVDSKDYDAKINSARQGLLAMEQACRKVGGTFEVVEKEELQFVQALGQMQTVSNTTKGKLRELTNSINDLTTMYKGMTDAEKSSQFGQALSASIDQLKGRASNLKDQMDDLNEELNHMASDTAFSDGMRTMTGTIGSCASAVVAWSGDGREMEAVIKDLAKIQSTIAAVEALTKAFQKQNLTLLKNPYVIATAAVASLGYALVKTYENTHKLTEEQQNLRDIMRTSAENTSVECEKIKLLNERLHDNTLSVKERKVALNAIKETVTDYHADLTTEGTLINDNITALEEWAKKVKEAAFAAAAFDKIKEKEAELLEIEDKLKESINDPNNPLSEKNGTTKKNNNSVFGFNVDNLSYTNEPQYSVRESNALAHHNKLLDERKKKLKEIDELEQKISTRGAASTGGNKPTHPTTVKNEKEFKAEKFDIPDIATLILTYVTESMSSLKKEESYWTKKKDSATNNEERQVADNMLGRNKAKQGANELALTAGISSEMAAKVQEAFNEQLKIVQDGIQPLEIVIDTKKAEKSLKRLEKLKKTQQVAEGMAEAFAGAGNVIEAFGAKNEAAAKASAALTFATTVSTLAATMAQKLATSVTIWDWIAGGLAGVAALGTMVAAIKSANSGFAEGGIIGGSTYSGDTHMARLNSGEMVINQSDQRNLYDAIHNGNIGGGGGGNSYISGEQIVTVINAYGRRTGRGEILR